MADYINKAELIGIVITPAGIIDAPEPYGCLSLEILNEAGEDERFLKVWLEGQAARHAKVLQGGEKVRLIGKVTYPKDYEHHTYRASATFHELEVLNKD